MVEITVVLPVYNGASYLDKTLDALKGQDFDDFEVLCIDDCSTDESARIIQAHARADDRLVYIRPERNLGSAAKAINFIRKQALGKRFVYSSQDDLFSPDWLSQLYARAISSGADAVLPDVEFYFENGAKTRRITGYHGDHDAVITGRDAFVASLDWSIAGNALWPMSLLKELGFSDFGAFSDEYTVRKFFLACRTVAFCKGVFFYRQDNAQAITKKPSVRRLDEASNNLMVWKLAVDNGFGPDVHGQFALRCLRSAIRARGIIFNTPALLPEAIRVEALWQEMQDPLFAASLDTGITQKHSGAMAALYRRAARSKTWFLRLARASAFAAARHKRS